MNPLVMVHGFMGGSDQWDQQSELRKKREVVCVDLPGFGRNAHMLARDSISGFATWVLEELERQSVQKFDLLGHSMGGMVVQDMVRQAPKRVDRLILYGAGPVGALPGRFESIETSIKRAAHDGAAATARRISATWFLEQEKASGYPACATIAEQSTPASIEAGLRAMQGWTGEAHIKDIASKTFGCLGRA